MKYVLFLFWLSGSMLNLNAQVEWDGEGGDGLWSSPKNWSMDVLPTSDDIVLIGQDFVVLADINSTIEQIILEDEAILTIASTRLQVVNSASHGVVICELCELEIEGGLEVINPDSIGIYNYGLLNNSTGEISISEARDFSLLSRSIVRNLPSAEIHIAGINIIKQPGGIRIAAGMMENKGKITVTNVFDCAICIDSLGTLENEGEVNLNLSQGGLSNYGSVLNKGSLEVINTFSGFFNANSVTNNAEGVIKVFDVATSGINNFDGTLINHGELVIARVGAGGGHAINNATKLENLGRINISAMHSRTGIDNQDTLLNNGIITIDSAKWGIKHDGYFENNDSILLSHVTDGGIELCNGKMDNYGYINIDQSEKQGILAQPYDLRLINNGTIDVSEVKDGIQNFGIIHNNGDLRISDFTGIGIGNNLFSEFINSVDAITEIIPHSSFDPFLIGIRNRGTIHTSGKLDVKSLDSVAVINYGTLVVDNPMNSTGLTSRGIFINQDSVLISSGGIISNEGHFINEGSAGIEGLLFINGSTGGEGLYNSGSMNITTSGKLSILKYPNSGTSLESILSSAINCYGQIEINTDAGG